METSIMDSILPVSEEKQWRERLAPLDQQESTVHRQSVRTNNDVEGWHHRINRKAQKPNLQMYILIVLLHKEARLLPTQLKMVRGKTLMLPKEMQHRIFALWDKYSEQEITVNQ